MNVPTITSVTLKDPQSGQDIPIFIPENERFRLLNIFQDHEYKILDKLDPNADKVIVDVGANVGCYAIYGQLTHPGSRILCFEPCPDSIELLEKNTDAFDNISVYPFGLFDEDKKAVLGINAENSGENSIKRDSGLRNTCTVELRRASSVLRELGVDEVDILKIDTEGCEVEILTDLKEQLAQVKFVLVEFHNEKDRLEIDALMADTHILCECNVAPKQFGLGTSKYIRENLLNKREYSQL